MDEIEFTLDFSLPGRKPFQETEEEPSAEDIKWQPLMAVVLGGRIECSCGNQAIFVVGKLKFDTHSCLEEVEAYCQMCFERLQEEEF